MSFIKTTDYLDEITLEGLIKLVDSDLSIIDKAESKAIELVRASIGQRYDLSKAFPIINDFKNGVNYNEGQYVFFEYEQKKFDFFKCTGNTLQSPTQAPDKWVNEDPRNPLLVEWTAQIALYKIYKRAAPNNVPEIRKEDFKYATKKLLEVQKGEFALSLEKVSEENEVNTSLPFIDSKDEQQFYW